MNRLNVVKCLANKSVDLKCRHFFFRGLVVYSLLPLKNIQVPSIKYSYMLDVCSWRIYTRLKKKMLKASYSLWSDKEEKERSFCRIKYPQN